MTGDKLQTLKYKKIAYMGKIPQVSSLFVAPNCFIIGDVILKEGSSVWFGSIIRGDITLCQIGEGSAVMEHSFIENSMIGANTLISHGAIIHKCEIGNDVLVGIGARVINGAQVGDNSIVGAGSVILPKTRVPPNSIVIGNGKITRNCTEADIKYIRDSVTEVVEKAKLMVKALQELIR